MENKTLKIKVTTLEQTKKLANIFTSCLNENGLFVTLTGDIGAGKTQFVRYVLEKLEVSDKVTSPSFVILNEYKCKKFPIYHFDLYRLEEKGLKSIIEELREYSKEKKLTFIEWAEFAHDEIPNTALKINVIYDEEDVDIRYFEFSSNFENNIKFIEEISKGCKNEHLGN